MRVAATIPCGRGLGCLSRELEGVISATRTLTLPAVFNAICSAYYIRSANSAGVRADPTKWILFMEGGGWASSLAESVQRTKTNLGSSNGYPVHPVGMEGVSALPIPHTQNSCSFLHNSRARKLRSNGHTDSYLFRIGRLGSWGSLKLLRSTLSQSSMPSIATAVLGLEHYRTHQ